MVESHRPSPDWPAGGNVTFKHYSTRYREGLDLVLKDVNADVPAGTKVGLVRNLWSYKPAMLHDVYRLCDKLIVLYIGSKIHV